ncbi:cadherin-89D isoform 1-T2 [Synchiropus picturatus]
MAPFEKKWSLSQTQGPLCAFILLLHLYSVTGMSGWGGCLDGQNVFSSIRENSVPGEVISEFLTDTSTEGIHWSLDGKDADWFMLDGKYIRINTSAQKVLDREEQGPVLMAELSCYEEDVLQSVYRIMVEVINENDNLPVFAENTVQSLVVSELTSVDSLIFTVQATDADNDQIIYSVDRSSPDAQYFKFDLPNSGEVILAKPLDFETKSQLSVTIYASEMNTEEHYNTSTDITIIVQDGDDQYPQFLPCTMLFHNETTHVCINPEYSANITEGEEGFVLDVSPGPIHAVDGDIGVNSSISYAILSGNDNSHFLMDRKTGEVRLTKAVTDRLTSPTLHLQIMAYQNDDSRKYSVTTLAVRVLPVNHFHPQFSMAEYKGFVSAGKSPLSLVNTYGGKALILHVQDQDFDNGFNQMIYFNFSPASDHTDIYQITRDGLVIARTDQLRPKQKHFLKVIAVDQETDEVAYASVLVEVLPEGQSIPHSALTDERALGCTVGKALFLSMVFMTGLGCILAALMWLKRKHRGHRDPLERGCVAQGKHPNVSLRWFQLVNHQSAMPQMEDLPFSSEDYGTCNPSFNCSEKPELPSQSVPREDALVIPVEEACSPLKSKISVSILPQCAVEESSTQGAPPPRGQPRSPQSPPNTISSPTNDTSPSPPFTCLDSERNSIIDLVGPSTSQSAPTSPLSHMSGQCRAAPAETEKPFIKPRVSRPYSPLLSSPVTKHESTPPSTPEHAPLKATLVEIDTSPGETPPLTPSHASSDLTPEETEPSTSLDLPDIPEEVESLSAGPRLSAEEVLKEEDDDGNLGDEDKNSDSGEELDPDDEELLRVMARCNPIFITFTK